MTSSPTVQEELWVGAVCSLAFHVLVIAVLVVVLWVPGEGDDAQDEQSDDQPDEYVEVTDQHEPPPPPQPPEDLPAEQSPPPQQQEEPPEQQEEQEQEDEDPPDQQEDEQPEEQQPDESVQEKIAVDQPTDDDHEDPEQADHIADEAHRTEEETVAETTTLEDVAPQEDPEGVEQQADTERELAMEVPDEELEEPDIVDPTDIEQLDDVPEQEEIDDDIDDQPDEQPHDSEQSDEETEPEDVAEDDAADRDEELAEQQQFRDPDELIRDPEQREEEAPPEHEQPDSEQLFGADANRAQELFDDQDFDDTDGSARSGRSGRQLLANWRENEQEMRAALENFVPHVQPGNHTSVNAQQADHASYIARIHRIIHANWGDGFLVRLANNFPNHHPLNDMSLETVVEIVIDADSGEVEETVRVEPSGNEMFDAEALNVARNVGDHPDPPDSIVSADGNVYIHWTFWRDQRQCGTFGVSIYQLEEGEHPGGDSEADQPE